MAAAGTTAAVAAAQPGDHGRRRRWRWRLLLRGSTHRLLDLAHDARGQRDPLLLGFHATLAHAERPQAVNPTTLTGTAGIEAGDNSTISLDFISASQPTVTVQGSVSQTDGAFSVAVPSLARGAWRVRAVQRDSAGNETRTDLRSFNRVDTPTITWPTPDPHHVRDRAEHHAAERHRLGRGHLQLQPALGRCLTRAQTRI